jgi:hypothetical protein
MSKVISLSSVKNKKKYKKYIEDIDDILKVLSTSQKALSFFKHYITVQEIISVIETNKTFLELNRNKYEKELSKTEE